MNTFLEFLLLYCFIGTLVGVYGYYSFREDFFFREDDKGNLAIIQGVVWPIMILIYLVSYMGRQFSQKS